MEPQKNQQTFTETRRRMELQTFRETHIRLEPQKSANFYRNTHENGTTKIIRYSPVL